MAISIKRYVDITSGVGAAGAVRQRELIGLLFTSNNRVPINTTVEMTTSDEVGAYFGTASIEYKRAAFYFDYISKMITRPKKISFSLYVSSQTSASIFGGKATTVLNIWKSLVNASLVIISNGTTANLQNLDFSSAASLADVATTIQTALRALSDEPFQTATFTYDAVRSSFNFVSGTHGQGNVSVDASSVNSIAGYLGWTGTDTIFSPGANSEQPVDAFLRAANSNNNFGSFAFVDSLMLDDITAVAEANSGRNIEFHYCVPVASASDAQTYSEGLKDYSGVSVTFRPKLSEYDEMAPMILLASTDYERRNGTISYMFNDFALSAKINSTSDADIYDRLRINYMGVTQTAGQQIKFYQRGVMMGLATAPVDMNTYANEAWFKDAAASALMNLFLSLPKVPANTTGRGQVMAILQSVIERALYNGTISVGKDITAVQQLYISQITGDDLAWLQVQNIGYWLDCTIDYGTTLDGRSEWKATYLLVYSKDDTIRKIEGTHTLI